MQTQYPPLTIIVAADQKNGIGIKNDLPWRLSDDLKRFKAITTAHTIIMGRNTWFSLPRRPLPNRRNIVLTNEAINEEGAELAWSIDEVMGLCDPQNENFIIGGDSIYRQFLPFCQKVLLTRVNGDFDTDTFFPDLDPQIWHQESESELMTDSVSGITYTYLLFTRK